MENDYRVLAFKQEMRHALETALTLEGFTSDLSFEGLLLAHGEDGASHLLFVIRSPYLTLKGKLAWDFCCKTVEKIGLIKF